MRYGILTLAALTACASSPEWNWARDGATRAQFDQDGSACEAQALAATATIPGASAFGSPGFYQAATQRLQIEDACMRSKGWRKVASK